jgi:omega-6 fatty acid desaturase (delta-12 desaturase)
MTALQMPEQITPKFQRLKDDTQKIEGARLADAIPKKLYQPRVWRGMLSFTTSYALYLTSVIGVAYAPHWLLYLPLWLLAGLGGWGLFCVAHDCGHNSFSRSRRLNTAIGHISLIPLLYPFHGWRHMHNMHHANTNSFEMDTDWRPVLRFQYDRMTRWEKFVYSSTRSWLFWLGTVNYQRHSGFSPSMLPKREARNEVRRSILFTALVAVVCLPTLIYFTGVSGLFLYFIAPWLGIHAWFSMTTMMHHISNETPFLTKEHWTSNTSRLLLTTDYMYPKWLLFLTHYISVHTAHHVAPIIPHYNLPQAQTALKQAYPGMVREKPMELKDIWRVARYCHLYDPVTGYYEAFDQAPAKKTSAAPLEDVSVEPSLAQAEIDSTPLNFRMRLLQGYINLLSKISVKSAGRKATDIFGYTRALIPTPPKDVVPLGAQRFPIENCPGVAHGYCWNRGVGTILLIHGWGADSSTMYSFTRSLQSQGFKVAAFDAPAHGVSPGKVTTMTDFKNAVKAALDALGDVVGIVAHSLGGIAATGALAELAQGHQVRGLCFIGSPATLPAVMQRWSQHILPVSPEVLQAMHSELWSRNGVPVGHWDIPALGQTLEMPKLVIHARNDKVVPVFDAEFIAGKLGNVSLELYENQGHIRILSDPNVVDRVAQFMRDCQVDTPDAFADSSTVDSQTGAREECL